MSQCCEELTNSTLQLTIVFGRLPGSFWRLPLNAGALGDIAANSASKKAAILTAKGNISAF